MDSPDRMDLDTSDFRIEVAIQNAAYRDVSVKSGPQESTLKRLRLCSSGLRRAQVQPPPERGSSLLRRVPLAGYTLGLSDNLPPVTGKRSRTQWLADLPVIEAQAGRRYLVPRQPTNKKALVCGERDSHHVHWRSPVQILDTPPKLHSPVKRSRDQYEKASTVENWEPAHLPGSYPSDTAQGAVSPSKPAVARGRQILPAVRRGIDEVISTIRSIKSSILPPPDPAAASRDDVFEPKPPSAWPSEEPFYHQDVEAQTSQDRRRAGQRSIMTPPASPPPTVAEEAPTKSSPAPKPPQAKPETTKPYTGRLRLHSEKYPICQDRIDVPRRLVPAGRFPLRPVPKAVRDLMAGRSKAPIVDKTKTKNGRDEEVDSLVSRAKILRLGTQEVQNLTENLRLTYRNRKAAQQAEKERVEREAAEEAERVRLAKQAAEEEDARAAEAQLLAEQEAQEELERLKKPKLIPSLNEDWLEKLKLAMRAHPADKQVATASDGTPLTRKDFGTLLSKSHSGHMDAWLNDEIINAWFGSMVDCKLEESGWKKGEAAPYAVFNTAWFVKMRNEGVQSVQRWSRRKGIQNEKLLSAKKVYLPINTGVHWILLIISPVDRQIEVLDSMGGTGRAIIKVAREWLQMELGSKYKAEEWTELESKSSAQSNSDDCGVFTCLNGLASIQNRPYNEVTSESMQDCRRFVGAVLINGGFKGDFAF